MNEILDQLKQVWDKPKKGVHSDEPTFFELSCEFSKETAKVPVGYPFEVPEELVNFWGYTSEAALFIDKTYGQWGLKVFSPKEAVLATKKENELRADEYNRTDLVIGEFIGDSDKLVIDCSPKNLGQILVSMPFDPRKEWWVVSSNFKDFLRDFSKKEGEKYWESDD